MYSVNPADEKFKEELPTIAILFSVAELKSTAGKLFISGLVALYVG